MNHPMHYLGGGIFPVSSFIYVYAGNLERATRNGQPGTGIKYGNP